MRASSSGDVCLPAARKHFFKIEFGNAGLWNSKRVKLSLAGLQRSFYR
jgi:hypothetical protein